jgi:hypothetical protein
MSRRILTAIALAVLALAGCGKPIEARAARGFVELSDTGAYDFRAVAPEGVAVAARAVRLGPGEPTDLAFWERAIGLRMRELDGYALVESKDATGADGMKGRELVFGHDEDGKPHVYRIRVFVERGKLLVVEAGGSQEQMKLLGPGVEWMLGQIRLR